MGKKPGDDSSGSSSSDEEDLSRFQSVAVSGQQVAAASTSAPSFKVHFPPPPLPFTDDV